MRQSWSPRPADCTRSGFRFGGLGQEATSGATLALRSACLWYSTPGDVIHDSRVTNRRQTSDFRTEGLLSSCSTVTSFTSGRERCPCSLGLRTSCSSDHTASQRRGPASWIRRSSPPPGIRRVRLAKPASVPMWLDVVEADPVREVQVGLHRGLQRWISSSPGSVP